MRAPHPILTTLAATLLLTTAARAELQLEALVHGKRLPVTGVEHHQIICGSGDQATPLPPSAKLVLDGDLHANAGEVLWSPHYNVWRVDVPDRERATIAKPYRVSWTLRHLAAPATKKKQTPDAFLRAWPGGTRAPAVVVFAWIVDGRPVDVLAHAVPSTQSGRDFDVSGGFVLNRDEARGELITLLWSGGHFVPPVPRFTNPRAEAAFHAVELNDIGTLRAALAAGLSPDTRDRRGVPLLQYAAETGALPCLDALLSAGAKADAHGRSGTPMSWAAADGRSAAVRRLLAAKARPDGNNSSALLFAIDRNHEKIALALITAGARLDAQDAQGETPVAAALNGGMARVVELLIRSGADLDLYNEQSSRALTTQAKLGHAAVVQFMLAQQVSQDHAMALIAGAISGDPVIAKALIAHGAKPDEPGPNGVTALMMTASHDRAQYAEALLDAGAHPDTTTPQGATALHLAANSNAVKVARVLLQHGANFKLRVGHSTPLDVALAVHARETAVVLAAAGAQIDLHSPVAEEDLERAIEYDLAPLISAAIADGWSPNSQFSGWPALDLAQAYGSKQCAEVLAHAGARLTASAPRLGDGPQLERGVRPTQFFRPEDPRLKHDSFPEAEVLVEAIVDRDGTPRFVRLVKTHEFSLAKPAVDAVSHWRFQPAVEHHKPVPFPVEIPVVFPSSETLWPYAADLDQEPQVIHQVAPEYPRDLARTGYFGAVNVRFLVTATGHPERIEVLTSVHPELTEAATKAVSQWTFKPGLLDGKPVPCWETVPIVFEVN